MILGTELLASNTGLIGLFTLLITLVIGLVKVIEFLIKKALPKKNTLSEQEYNKIKDIYILLENILKKTEEDSENKEELHEWVHHLYEQHHRVDRDGVPLWYFPRSFIETQKEIISILLSYSSQMDKSTYILDSLLKQLDEMDRYLRTISSKG